MVIIGVDYHPSFQAIAFFEEETGECGEQELNHSDGQAEKFYRELKQRGESVRVGMEATGYSRWSERLLAELGFELWIGDPAEIKTKRVKKQKTDRNDARLLLRLMREDVLIIGTLTRFQRGKQIGTYVGMIPSEDSSAGKQRLGHISKQGNSLTNEGTLRSKPRSTLAKRLTEPTLLEMSGYPGGLNRSVQHHLI
ncbi:MAG TPA: transposase [Candidatus Acidoferrales bacterium]|jgi:transposase|nr:transposase [Candidatus Acidoferrales bacterium]